MIWRSLKDDPPTGKEHCVILFPVRSDIGIPYTASNAVYAKLRGLEAGYTHWALIEPAPGIDEFEEWQRNIDNDWDSVDRLYFE